MTTEEIGDREAIRELYARYCFYVDLGRPDLFAADFAEDATLWLSDRGSYEGRDAILAHVGRRSGVLLHLIHNVAIDPIDGDGATSHAYFQLIEPEGATCVAYGMYDDLLVRDGDRWRWKIKKVNYHFRSPDYMKVSESSRRPDFGAEPPDVAPVCSP